MYKCKICEKIHNDGESYFMCCGITCIHDSYDLDREEDEYFEKWTAANCVVIGKDIKKYNPKEIKSRYERKSKLDRACWNDTKLSQELDKIYGEVVVETNTV